MSEFIKELRAYFENTPKEVVIADWKKYQKWDEKGVKVEGFFERMDKYEELNKKFDEALSKVTENDFNKWRKRHQELDNALDNITDKDWERIYGRTK